MNLKEMTTKQLQTELQDSWYEEQAIISGWRTASKSKETLHREQEAIKTELLERRAKGEQL